MRSLQLRGLRWLSKCEAESSNWPVPFTGTRREGEIKHMKSTNNGKS